MTETIVVLDPIPPATVERPQRGGVVVEAEPTVLQMFGKIGRVARGEPIPERDFGH